MKFTIRLKNVEQERGYEEAKISATHLFSRSYGLYLMDTETGREFVFNKSLWQRVEVGSYEQALRQVKPAKLVDVDGTKYKVSNVEVDSEGVLTLSLFNEIKDGDTLKRDNKWMLLLPSTSYEYMQSSKL